MNNYFIWEKSNIYTNFGSADLWILNKEYGQFNKFDDRVLSIGMLNNKTYNDKLYDDDGFFDTLQTEDDFEENILNSVEIEKLKKSKNN